MPSGESSAVPRESELLRAVVDKISAMLAYWDSSLRCRFANRAYERWFGVSPEQLIGKHIRELLGPLYELNLPYIERALRGEPQEFEREIPDPAGGPPRHSLANYIPDVVDGVVRGFFVLVTDISAIKRAELALRESEERFRLMIDDAPIGMALVALDGRFVRVNHVLCELVGYTAEELTGLTFQAITHPDDLDTDLALTARLARGEIPRYKLGKRYVRKDGSVVDVMLSGSALRSPEGAPVYYIAQIEDITEQKRLEGEQRFLAEIGPVLATTLDYEETLTRIAELAVRQFADLCIVDVVEDDDEVRRLKVASRDPKKAWICDSLRQIAVGRGSPHLLASVLQTRRAVLMSRPSEEAIASLAQGEEHLRALRAAEIRSMVAVPLVAHGTLLGAIALLSSASSRAYGTADLRFAEELAQRAALSIANARLYRAARRATQARDEVLGVVAHDLRNPLSIISMQAKLLERTITDPGQRAPAEVIGRAARRMNRLIEDLLDVTLLEAGRLSVVLARVPTRRVVMDAIEAYRALASSASMELRAEIAPDVSEVCADGDRLLQALENLVGNALKFTQRGGHVTVGASPREEDVLFWVKDTGSGIAEEDLPHVFDRFWRAKNVERRGAGLGLTIVKGIVQAHRGRVWAESTRGEGSSFFFTIPKAPPAEAG